MCVKSFRPCPAMAKENGQDVNQGQVEAGKVTRSPVKDLAEVWCRGSWNSSDGAHARHKPGAESVQKKGRIHSKSRSQGKALLCDLLMSS